MNYNAVNWFEIPVSDMSRARKFYENVFQREMEEVEAALSDMEMVFFSGTHEAPGAMGALVKSKNQKPAQMSGVLIYFSCQNITDELERVEKAGGSVLMPRTPIGEHGFIALIQDTEGNRIGMHSMA